MIDERDNDDVWLAQHGYIALERSSDLPEARYAPGVTHELWTFLDRKRQKAIRSRNLSKLDEAYAVNATIIRLKAIAARTGMVIGRAKPPGYWTDEARAAASERAKAMGLGKRHPQ